MLPTRRQLHGDDLTQAKNQRSGEEHQLVARRRVDSGVDLHDPGLRDCCGGDQEPSASDVERQRAYSDWLARFEPAQQRGRAA
jgi:hypothetical protein